MCVYVCTRALVHVCPRCSQSLPVLARKRPRDGATGATSVPAGDDQVVWVTPGTIPPAPPLPPNMVSSSDACASGGASASSGGALCKSSSGDTCSTKSSYFQAASKVTHLTPTSTLSRKPVAFVARTPGMVSCGPHSKVQANAPTPVYQCRVCSVWSVQCPAPSYR